ncbi:hypothetical protein MKW92_011999 [Papaver armeniacum]|nr:hypothetical protein MKW92_011999 [Papaver armeniacum]
MGMTEFPIILDKIVQILIISGTELERGALVKFDVFINDEGKVGPESSEFAGSFTNVPHKHGKKDKKIKTCLKLRITEILEDLDAEDDDDVLVTIIPRDSGRGKEVVQIEGIEIEFD